jgi:hypothetical protein
MKIINYLSRIIVGLTFLFSGTVKAIDPSGFSYKLQDYFSAFHMGFLGELSMVLAITMCTIEFIAGFSVLFNIRFKQGIIAVMLLMTFFTALTFVIALTNPVSDCGCFGDAVHLTNVQTLLKNIILLIPAVWLFLKRDTIAVRTGTVRSWSLIAITTLLFLVFIFYNLRYLPVIDFLPYKTGTHIPDKMIVPSGMPTDKYETTFIYEKNGEQKEFNLQNYPANDTSWKFIDQKSVLVSRGYTPPIHDFVLTSLENEDLTGEVLSNPGYVMLMISKKIDEADPALLKTGFETGQAIKGDSVDFYILTASTTNEIRNISNGLQFLLVDETTLKTMIRSNPGYILLKNGTILHKWSWANLPGKEELSEILNIKTN